MHEFAMPIPDNIGPTFRPVQDVATNDFFSTIFDLPTEPQPDPSQTRLKPNGLLAKLGVPCQQPAFEDYGGCFSYYANGSYHTCQFVDVEDIEDFMNNEKRKEKSRDAARSRRSRETEIFADLANALPITSEQISQLDKASIMRLAIAYFKVRNMIDLVPTPTKEPDNKPTVNDGSMLLKSLEGFAIVLSPEGDIIYVSENVSNYLGILQIDLMGQNIFEYSHPCDHDEIRDAISNKGGDSVEVKSLFIRLKCTLTSKGRSVNLKSATYKVIHCSGHMIKKSKDLMTENDSKAMTGCFLAVGQPIPHPSNIEAPLPRQTFLTKHGLDMKFIHADDDFMKNTLGYEPDDLLNKSFYDYHHAMDSDAIFAAYKCLFSKGQCETPRYRFLAKHGGYVWVVTQATLLYDKLQKPQSIVSVNYVLSGLECKDEIYAAFQVRPVVKTPAEEASSDGNNNDLQIPTKVEEVLLDAEEESTTCSLEEISNRKPISNTAKLFGFLPAKDSPVSEPAEEEEEEEERVVEEEEETARPRINTSQIFGPRTKDMNKGFLTFSEEKPGLTMLKDEPDDLTHLAPVAGDVCVPLDDHPFLSDVLDDILLKDNFAPLLAEEPSDPFICYRDHDPSPQLLSPNLSKASDSLASLSSPCDSLLDEDHMSTFMTLHLEEETEMSLKAPYIPMELTDDLPLLMPSELMWNGGEKKKHQEYNIAGVISTDNNSSLAHLLSTSLTNRTKANDHGSCGVNSQQDANLDIFGDKTGHKTWSSQMNTKVTEQLHIKTERTPAKRSSASLSEQPTKRAKSEPKEKMSSELLQQLMSNNHHRGRPKGRSNWLLDSGGQKAACISQPSDSVLMNLLDPTLTVAATPDPRMDFSTLAQLRRQRDSIMADQRRHGFRKNSITMLEPDNECFASLMDLTPHDFEVNAPVQSLLLQGQELLSALEANTFS